MKNTLTLTLLPHWRNGTVASLDLAFSFPAEGLGDAPQLRFPKVGFGGAVPFPEYENLQLSDEQGDLSFEVADSPEPYGPISYRDLTFSRPAEGTVRWRYRALPRVLPEGYRSSPYYDFRAEPGGLNGVGFFSFILPAFGTEFTASVHWELSDMPSDARGVFAYGEGDFTVETNTEDFMLAYYAVGVMHSVEDGNFGVYWFREPDFDMLALARKLQETFRAYARFFHDENPLYRIFIRRDPFPVSCGGTAGTRSFLSGYNAVGIVDQDHWYSVLAHEILHNWPAMDDTNYGEATWYNEGCAEYYSTMLPLRADLTTPEYAARQINNKVGERYLDNPYREVSNMDLNEIQWKDRRGQTVPYGRGCLYLANTDAVLRRRGLGSIDDIISAHDKKNQIRLSEWVSFVRDRLGNEGLQAFEDMKAGKLLTPDPDAFDGRFECFPVTVEIDGKECTSYRFRPI